MTSFVIERVAFERLDVPIKKAFGISGGAQASLANVLVSVELAGGGVGLGEAAPLPPFNGETQEGALSALRAAGPTLVGEDIRRWRPLAERIADLCAGSASAACALETALLDALTRALGTSLRVFFGGAEETLVTDVTITTGTAEEAAREARTFSAFRTLKIKVGGPPGHDPALDVARVLAVHEARPDARLLLDANGGLTLEGAVALDAALRARGVRPAVFEQPLSKDAGLEAFAELRARTGAFVVLDESITCAADVVRAHRAGAADGVNVKLMKCGWARALDVASAARAAGLATMIGGMVESRLAVSASACFAAGLGGFAEIDLDTPLFLSADPFDGGYTRADAAGERLDLRGIALGHGCRWLGP
jgi:L-Ala-D/L-Glu epimerase / N-acetyl-D-glutamate racemase